MTPLKLGPDNGWICQLTDRGEKLVPLIYEFVPEDVPGYTWTVKQNGANWVIEYIQDQPNSLTVTPEKLVLTVDGWANVTISEHFASDVYDSLEWQTEGTEDVIEVRHISGNTYQVRAKATGISTLTAKLGEDLKSNPCTVVVLPKELSMDPVSLTTGGQKQLTVKEAELLQAAGVTVSWTSDDPKVAGCERQRTGEGSWSRNNHNPGICADR